MADSDWRAWALQHIFICFALSCITRWEVLSHSLLWTFIIHSLVLTGLRDNSSLDSEIVTAREEKISQGQILLVESNSHSFMLLPAFLSYIQET